ncbi:MAG TPA: translesion error-prone DNA polymerase V autoproteolytic subunit [Flavisolibacter sp.]|nr:translesion error-prone DNA polymerase V autoproteolytic subunit [Flavisolibacter sp.]
MAVKPIKFLGYVQAGFPAPASDYMDEGIDLNKELISHPASTFFFKATGESMIGAHIPPGSILVVDRSVRPRNNSIVLAVVDGEYTVKFYVQNHEGLALVPANPKFKSIIVTEGMDFSIWGVVTSVIIKTTKYGIDQM